MVGDTVYRMFAALLRDAGTATPPISEQELQRLRIELNRLQALSEPLAAIKRGGDLTADVFLSVTGNDYYHVSGTTVIQGLYQQPAGSVVWLEFDNALSLQNSSTLILQDNKDFTTHTGDVFGFIAENDGVWREISRRLAASGDTDDLTSEDVFNTIQQTLVDSEDIAFLTDGAEISAWLQKKAASLYAPLGICEGRLTLTTLTPVTTADVTAATSIFFTPYKGNRISLFDGTNWNTLTFSEITIPIGTLTASLPYDLFAYASGNIVAFDRPVAWASATARATALVLQNGVLVKSGDPTRRYVGTFYTQTTTTTEDSAARRLLFNYYNRVARPLACNDATDTWAYTVATWRAANANTTDGTGRVAVLVGFSEDAVRFINGGMAETSAAAGGSYFAVGIGLDVTNANSAQIVAGAEFNVTGNYFPLTAAYEAILSVGYHFIQRLEISTASGTTTWAGDLGSAFLKTGMTGMVLS